MLYLRCFDSFDAILKNSIELNLEEILELSVDGKYVCCSSPILLRFYALQMGDSFLS